MTLEEKIKNVQTRLGNIKEATDELIAVFLNDAKVAVLEQRYPFGIPESVEDVPERYENIQCQLAERYFLRQGIGGQLISIENGIHKTFESADDSDLLKRIIQIAKVGQ